MPRTGEDVSNGGLAVDDGSAKAYRKAAWQLLFSSFLYSFLKLYF